MAHKKAGGSSRNGRDSDGRRLGVKKFGGERVVGGMILERQRGTKFHPGRNVGIGTDHTPFATAAGEVALRVEGRRTPICIGTRPKRDRIKRGKKTRAPLGESPRGRSRKIKNLRDEIEGEVPDLRPVSDAYEGDAFAASPSSFSAPRSGAPTGESMLPDLAQRRCLPHRDAVASAALAENLRRRGAPSGR